MNEVVVLSLEPWDDTWRRNQHLASRLISDGHARHVTWVSPARRGMTRQVSQAQEGVTVIVPPLIAPRRAGGVWVTGHSLKPVVKGCDVLWVNDPRLGSACLRHGVPAVYDVTDDWRSYPMPRRILRRVIRAEDRLARRATTIVCSETLAERWERRYGITPTIIHNGVDLAAHTAARTSLSLPGPRPHVGYVGTLQPERLDLNLVRRTAALPEVGTMQLIGPDALGERGRAFLDAAPNVRVHPPVPAREVPGLMSGLDVLVSPHLINPFTLSLDAIKGYEYAASGQPVVATPTSGFQFLNSVGVRLGVGDDFLKFVREVLLHPEQHPVRPVPGSSWQERAAGFAAALLATAD